MTVHILRKLLEPGRLLKAFKALPVVGRLHPSSEFAIGRSGAIL
jgi:hypothetical protein